MGHRLGEPLVIKGLENVIEGMVFERLQGVLVVRGHKYDHRQFFVLQSFEDPKAV